MLRTQDKRLFVGQRLGNVLRDTRQGQPVEFIRVQPQAGGSNNTKNTTWTTIVDPVPFDADGVVFILTGNTANRELLFDLGIGAAASEVAVINNILFSSGPVLNTTAQWGPLPLPIPAGVRLSVRSQCSTASEVVNFTMALVRSYPDVTGFPFIARRMSPGFCETFGADTSDSGGTAIDPGADADTKGDWVSLGTTTRFIFALALCVGNRLNSARSLAQFHLDVAAGASQQISVVEDLWMRSSTTLDLMVPQMMGPFPCAIPVGTEIFARASSSITDATDRLFDLVAYGIA